MKKAIFYYTGTGNSLWVAQTLAKELGDTELIPISVGVKGNIDPGLDTAGLIFPVHMWGVPSPVAKFTDELKALQPGYVFAAAVHAGQVSNTLVQLKGLMKKKGLTLSSGFEIEMPTNYTPWGGPGPKEEQQRRFDVAKAKIAQIAVCVNNKDKRAMEKGPLWQRIVFTSIYKLTLAMIPKMDSSFHADKKCNKCGICAKVCPVQNITLAEGKPVWHHKCEQCFACLQWCPQEAILDRKSVV
jgi:ferredoxin/flavodoxin